MKNIITLIFALISLVSYSQVKKNQEWVFEKKVTLEDSLRIIQGANPGYVLTSDSRGIATWQPTTSNTIQSVSVTLDSATIVSLHTNPITIIPSQGANTVIQPIRIITYLDYNGLAYNSGGSTLQFLLGGSLVKNNNSILLLTNDVLISNGLSNSSTSAPIAQINGALTVTEPTSNPSGGNSTIKITILYSVINL